VAYNLDLPLSKLSCACLKKVVGCNCKVQTNLGKLDE
jgi:hypothetical protein